MACTKTNFKKACTSHWWRDATCSVRGATCSRPKESNQEATSLRVCILPDWGVEPQGQAVLSVKGTQEVDTFLFQIDREVWSVVVVWSYSSRYASLIIAPFLNLVVSFLKYHQKSICELIDISPLWLVWLQRKKHKLCVPASRRGPANQP